MSSYSDRKTERMLVARMEEDRDSIRTQLTKAVSAIKKYAAKKEEEAQKISGTVELISTPPTFLVTFALDKIPKKKDFRFREIPVPHRVVDITDMSMCLLSRDPKEAAVASVKKEELPFEKIICVKSLKRKYATHEARKELCARYDLFFCEAPIYEMMGALLGSYFFENRKSKIPTPLTLLTKNHFEKALKTARFRIRGGATFGIKVGNIAMESEHLIENAIAVIEWMTTKYCTNLKAKNDIFQVGVSATNVIELPIWSVPVDQHPEETSVVTPETPKKVVKTATIPTTTPSATTAELPDIATVPVKQLKQLQKARADAAKEQVGATNKRRKSNSSQ